MLGITQCWALSLVDLCCEGSVGEVPPPALVQTGSLSGVTFLGSVFLALDLCEASIQPGLPWRGLAQPAAATDQSCGGISCLALTHCSWTPFLELGHVSEHLGGKHRTRSAAWNPGALPSGLWTWMLL